MKKALIFLLFILTFFSIHSQTNPNRQVVITIDDLPLVSRLNDKQTYSSVTEGILKALKDYNAPGIGFVNEKKLEIKDVADPFRVALLEDWLKAGMELGNHSYSHPDLNRITLEEYQEDILKGETITKELLGKYQKEMRYFRHPFLHTGNTSEKKEGLAQFLAAHDYQPAPVTIDNAEWIFARAYDNAILAKDEKMKAKIGGAYLAYMEAKTAFYEGQSKKLFQREIPQILLIHANTLNRDYLGELLQMFHDRGYAFISMEKALEDSAYDSKDEFVGIPGITWLDRWALTRKMPKEFFQGEPPAPKFIQDYAGIRE